MGLFKRKLAPAFNDCGKTLNDYTLTLTKPDGDPAAQAADFAGRLSRWLLLQGEGARGNAKAPEALDASREGNARVKISCLEATIAQIERQFAAAILRTDPPAEHVRGAIYPPKVDPWDVSKW